MFQYMNNDKINVIRMNIYKYDPGKHSFKNIEVSSVQETY